MDDKSSRPVGMPTMGAAEAVRHVEQLIAGDTEVARYSDILTSLLCESDRGCVLVASAMIDEELRDALRTFFASRAESPKGDVDAIFKGPMAPLQSTSWKIKVAMLLGLLQRPTGKSALELQSLRSRIAAHTRQPFVLEETHCREILKHIPNANPKIDKMITLTLGSDASIPPRVRLALAVVLIIDRIARDEEAAQSA